MGDIKEGHILGRETCPRGEARVWKREKMESQTTIPEGKGGRV